ncbi:MAG: hypothetical protein H6719_29110, partial [Sandaracinaceae bacterium]|nr:hypothetical protein [Sandaracinaceae bacterium]
MRSEEPLYLRRVKLSNIRALESLDLSFGDAPERPRRHTVVIGRNGTCKSTLLRAISLGLASKSDVAALLAAPVGGMIGPRGDHASIAVTAEAPSGLVVKTHVELRRWDDQEVVQTTLDN